MVILMNMSVFQINHGLKKVIKLVFKIKKPNRNQFKSTGFGSVILEQKPIFYAWFFLVWWFFRFSSGFFFNLAPFFFCFSLVFSISCL